jgi:hypothetical protein
MSNDNALRAIARRITLDADKKFTPKGHVPCSELRVGQFYIRKGKIVYISDGQYMGEHGLSNFWHWHIVDEKTGKLGPEQNGYGGGFKKLPKGVKVELRAKVTRK